MKPSGFLLIIIFTSNLAFAQLDDYIHYNYKSHHEVLLDSLRKHYGQKDYEGAAKFLSQINLLDKSNTENFYINGIAIYKHLALQVKDNALKVLYAQNMLELYDIRMQRFDNESSVANRKLYDYFVLMNDLPDAQTQAFKLYHDYFQENTEAIKQYNIIPYAYLARQMEQKK